MSFHIRLILLLGCMAAFLSTPTHRCQASTIAVLPVEDLSQGANGLNFAMSQTLADILAQKGFQVSSRDDVVSFMVKNRVRWLGSLSSPYIRRLHSQLQVDYLLLGSISQQQTAPPFAINLNLQLIRTKDCRIIWSSTTEESDVNKVSLLALSNQRDKEEIEHQVATEALATIPSKSLRERTPTPLPYIESVRLEPTILRPGEQVRCRIKLSTTESDSDQARVEIYAGEQIISTHYDSQAKSYIGSWLSAQNNQKYSVTAIISNGGQTSREIIIGNYRVDGTPPKLSLNVKGQELDGLVILQKQVKIIPTLEHPEKIARWQLTVHAPDGREIVSETGRSKLPPQFSWWGQEQNGNQVRDGYYAIQLSLWDRAGNEASSKESIRVYRAKPDISIAMEKQAHSLAVALNYKGEIPLAYWRLQIRDQDGMLIAERSGSEKSNKILLPVKMAAQSSLNYRIYAQDMLGNTVWRDVLPTTKKNKNGEDEKDDDGNFLASVEGKKMAGEDAWADDF